MADFGIKVSKPGYDVKTATDVQLVFSSKFNNLKVHQQGTGSLTHTSRTGTIAHNLGYVPKFLVHSQLDSFQVSGSVATDYWMSPYRLSAGACFVDRDVIAWADTNNLYIKVRPDFGWTYFYTDLVTNNYYVRDANSGWENRGIFGAGNGTAGASYDGAVRFDNVTITNSSNPYKSEVGFYIQLADANSTPVILKGVNQDNCADFSGYSPVDSGIQTTASYNSTRDSSLGSGKTWTTEVTNIVNEITSRGSWSSGNHLAITAFHNGGGTNTFQDAHISCVYCSCTYLRVLTSNTLTNYKYTIFKNRI